MSIAAALATAPTVTRAVQDGFDWGSAAVGAGFAVALVLVLAALLSVHRSKRRSVT